MTYEPELKAALESAALAGKIILEHYARFQAIADAPADISTEADRQSQQTILSHIHRAFPGDALCAEETTTGFETVPQAGQRLWIVDPIDGSRGFARKNGEFSVMVAFVDRGRVAVGVVLEPAKNRLTYAAVGSGCWRRDREGEEPQRCQVTSVSDPARATVTQSHSRNPSQPSAYIRALHPARVIETYSAGIKLAQVARGDADIYLNTYDGYHDWDIAAGQILVDEAGGRVTNLRGAPPQYGLPGALQRYGLLASNGRLHDRAIAVLPKLPD
jgi:3'(2'), 5'-bisphosphate nucleotidase